MQVQFDAILIDRLLKLIQTYGKLAYHYTAGDLEVKIYNIVIENENLLGSLYKIIKKDSAFSIVNVEHNITYTVQH